MKIGEIVKELETFAPLSLQEEYDNCGLLTGQHNEEASGALLCLDCTEEVIDEAIALGINLVIAHHPIIFKGLKKINGCNYTERTIIKAIKFNIAIYACHTNLDNVRAGVNQKICEKLGLTNLQILAPKDGLLKKLITYVPAKAHEQVLNALFAAGAGYIGNYSHCSFNTNGTGTFQGQTGSNPYIGKPNQLSTEPEIKIETIFESYNEAKILSNLKQNHPYEEVAFDVFQLSNKHNAIGSGMIGQLLEPMDEMAFLRQIKTVFKVPTVRHTKKTGKPVKTVAVCGGSGSFLLRKAIGAGVDAYITADVKYHEFFDAENKLLFIDTGHFESEQFTPEIFYDIIKKKFNTFAVHLSKINTNPINYF